MYKKDAHSGWKHLDFLLLDIVCLHISFILAYLLRHGGGNPYAMLGYRSMAIVLTLIDILVVFLFNSLKNVLKRGYYKEMMATLRHVCLVEMISICYMYAVQQLYSRLTFFYLAVFYGLISYFVRIAWKHLLHRSMKKTRKRSLLVVTNQEMKDRVLENLCANSYDIYYVCGAAVLDADLKGQSIGTIPVVAGCEDVADYVCRHWVDEVLMAFSSTCSVPLDLAEKLMQMGVVVHTMIALQDKWVFCKPFVERLGGYTVLTNSIQRITTLQLIAKRTLDIIGGFFGCILTGILFCLIAPAIYINSPGPIFFSQIRVGKNGKKFRLYKFRSMYPDAEARKKELLAQNEMKDSRMFKVKYDPRIIGCHVDANGNVRKGIGNFLRDTSLDEFPQFFNVLKGDMSLVGTRPPTVDEWEQYDYHHRARLAIKPGMTGMWQVNGRSRIVDFEEVVKLDMRYIAEWSMGLDLRILFKTIGVVLNRMGSM